MSAWMRGWLIGGLVFALGTVVATYATGYLADWLGLERQVRFLLGVVLGAPVGIAAVLIGHAVHDHAFWVHGR